LLLDTHVLLWALREDAQLSRPARKLIEDGENQIFVSAASIWEIAIKQARGLLRLDMETVVEILKAQSFEELPVRIAHTLHLRDLPNHHRDPFDRILIAQSITEHLRLMTADETILSYEGIAGFHPLPV
jgi:PIN domain nuclease of toxin-antitoxin system